MVAGALVRASGGLVTGERSPSRRHGVYVDTKMNGHGQQVVAPYSVRPLPGAPVATPVAWEELERLDPRELTIRSIPERVIPLGDLLADAPGGQRLRFGRTRFAGERTQQTQTAAITATAEPAFFESAATPRAGVEKSLPGFCDSRGCLAIL
jgi:DNA primase